MDGHRRARGGPPRRVAVGAFAPRRQPIEVYRRRRLVALLVATALVVGPCWALTADGGDGAVDGEADRPIAAVEDAAVEAVEPLVEADGEPTSDCAAAVTALPLRGRLALLEMVGVDGGDPDGIADLLAATDRPGGIFVRGGTTIWEEEGLVDPVDDGLPLFVAVDDEGGRVQRLKGILPDIPSAAKLAERTPEEVEAIAAQRAETLRRLGATMVLAPVLDLGEGGGIGDRSYSSDPRVVATYAGAWARGLRAGGLLPVVKHFPGEGRASADPHDGPVTAPGLEILRTAELVPYEALLADGPVGVMIGHLDVAGLTAEGVPASLSPDAIGLLRAGYEFGGLVITDDLVEMRAVTDRFSVPEAAERALAGGVDVVLLAHPTDVGAVLDRLVEAVETGRLPARRVDAALARVVAASGCAG